MPGAGVLCCNAAMRSGAGLVTYAAKEDFFNTVCALSKPETMFFVYGDSSDILGFIKERKVSAVIIGPGLKVSGTLRRFTERIIKAVEIPVILDASAIAAFNGKSKKLKKAKAKLILTPHAGEFAKLTGWDTAEINKDKKASADRFAEENSLICVLKGHNTAVADGENVYVNNSGTPAMAKAGSGDVLSGMIAAFCNTGISLFEAVKAAVYVHGLAGEEAEREKGGAGVIASDIIESIPAVMRRLNDDRQ
jgi:NAD(P)H-hydrate epimerase